MKGGATLGSGSGPWFLHQHREEVWSLPLTENLVRLFKPEKYFIKTNIRTILRQTFVSICVLVCRRPEAAEVFEPFPLGQSFSQPLNTCRSFILIGRNFQQWHCSTEQGNYASNLCPVCFDSR